MKLFIRDKVYFTEPTTGEVFEEEVTHIDNNYILGKKMDLTFLYNKGKLGVYRLHCSECGDMIPTPLSHFQVEGLKGKQKLLPSYCEICKNKKLYPENPEEGITLWI